MPPRLVHAAPAPPDRPVDLPPAHDLGVDPAATDALVAAEEVLVAPEAAHGPGAAEAPRADAQVAQVLHRRAAVDELPVQDGADPVRTDDEVAVAEVAVHDDVV